MKKVIVVGAGILGASTAYQLAKLGAEVLIVDRKDKGQATDAAAGIICPWLSQRRNKAWYNLARAGARFYPGLIEELQREGETETGYSQLGVLKIDKDIEKIKKIEERAQLRKADAPEIGEITILSEEETRNRFPVLAEGYHSLQVSGAARVDGRALRDALLKSAQRNGATLLTGDAKLQFNEKQVTGVKVGEEFYQSDEVIICTGVWGREILEPLGIHMEVSFQKGQILHMHVPEQFNMTTWPIVMAPSDKYLIPFNDQRIVIGATQEDNLDGYDLRVTSGAVRELLNIGLDSAPGLSNSTIQEVRVGFRPYTPGYLPIIGPLPGWDGIILANGLGASGLTMGPYLGSQLAQMALEMEYEIDVVNYDVQGALLLVDS